jgi:type IV secretory pathway VirB10-like protein
MIRTVWLAIACLAVLGALGIGKALTTSVAPATAERPLDETTIGADFGQETLTKADRLEIAYVPPEPLAPPELQPPEPLAPPVLQPTEPLRSAISSTVQQTETKIISRHWHDPNAPVSSAAKKKQTKQALSNKKSRPDAKRNQAADRVQPTEPPKPCNQTGPFSEFLRSLNLSPACAS